MGSRRPQQCDEEWIGGAFPMPASVTEGDTFRPELFVWCVVGGPVVATEVVRPGEALAHAAALYQAAVARPLSGPPRMPARVRVASDELVTALRAVVDPATQLVRQATPELAEIAESMRQHFARDDGGRDRSPKYLPEGVPPEALAGFFTAAARLYKIKPWTVVPHDTALMSLRSRALGIEGEIVSVIGQSRQSYALLMFASRDAFEEHMDGVDAFERGKTRRPVLPKQTALNFEARAEVPADVRKEIKRRGLPLAGPDAYPWLMQLESDLVLAPVEPRAMAKLTVVAHAVADLVERTPELAEAWSGGPGVEHTVVVDAPDGPVDITLTVPATWPTAFPELAFVDAYGEVDEARVNRYCEHIGERFAGSPEGLAQDGPPWAETLLHVAAMHQGLAVDELTPAAIDELLFEIFPRKVTVRPDAAPAIVSELRALLAFLERDLGLRNAGRCLRSLDDSTAPRMQRELANRDKWGMAKGVMMAGIEAGHDIDTDAGMAAWMDHLKTHPVPDSVRLPGDAPGRGWAAVTGTRPSPAAAKAAKVAKAASLAKRKAQRAARKKSR